MVRRRRRSASGDGQRTASGAYWSTWGRRALPGVKSASKPAWSGLNAW